MESTEMKIYISGPMSGVKDKNKEAFAKVEKALIDIGFEVVNPFSLGQDHDWSHQQYMKRDIAALMKCDGIIFLKDWLNSKGARIEAIAAASAGLAFLSFNDGKMGAEFKDSDELIKQLAPIYVRG